MTKSAFARKMRDETRKAYPQLAVKLDLEDFSLTLGDGVAIFNLDRAYDVC